MTSAAYDPTDPPWHAPDGADRLVWALARQIFADHQPTEDGMCRTCLPERRWPCEPHSIGSAGLKLSVSPLVPSAEHPYMPAPRGMPSPRHNGPGGRPDQWTGYVAEAVPPLASPLQVERFPKAGREE